MKRTSLLAAVFVAGLVSSTAAAVGEPTLEARIADRLWRLIEASAEAQYESPAELPPDRSFHVGEYPALVDFQRRTLHGLEPIPALQDVVDASGSSFMGLWFLSQAHRELGEVDVVATEPMRAAIRAQIDRARDLPRFFQGTTEDVWACPRETMGWYPLVDGYRLPALLPDAIERWFPDALRKKLANLSDGDIWAWCMAIDDNLPGALAYHDPITAMDVYAPLLGSRQVWSHLDPDSQELYLRVRGDAGAPRFPLGTFYGTTADKLQHFSTVVNANILSSIPLLGDVPEAYRREVDDAASFVDEATALALRRRLAWHLYAYDYDTIPAAAIAYVVRAHKRILQIGRAGYPHLLRDRTVAAAVRYVSRQARRRLADPDLHAPEGAEAYASLVYCFSAMMNLRYVDRDLFDDALVARVLEALLIPNPAARPVPGTGPYELFGPVSADMASICFVVPPLIEALALYLQIEL